MTAPDRDGRAGDLRAAVERLAEEIHAGGCNYRHQQGETDECNSCTAFRFETLVAHACEECADCIHDGNKCCGCYDGACCQAEHPATPAEGLDFIRRLVGAWDCCGTCAGGVLRDHDAALTAKAKAEGAREALREFFETFLAAEKVRTEMRQAGDLAGSLLRSDDEATRKIGHDLLHHLSKITGWLKAHDAATKRLRERADRSER